MTEIRTWRGMIDANIALLKRTTGEDATTWAGRARGAGIDTLPALKEWLAGQGITGYSALAVEWEMFGAPEFMLRSADELIDGQYADRPQLRPIADALMAWAVESGVELQARRTYVSLQTARRKFAQKTPATNSALDLILRVDAPAGARLEVRKAPAGDPFDRRVRLRSVDDVDAAVFGLLATAREQSS
jgi:hypothetical protein